MSADTPTGDELLAQALAQIPGLVEAQAAVAAVGEAHRELAREQQTSQRPAIVQRAVAEVLERSAVPAWLAVEYSAALADERAQVEYREALEAVKQRVEYELDELTRGGHDAAFEWLHAQVDEILNLVAEIGSRLGGARDADGAITAGPAAVDAWNELLEVAGRYAAVRAAQSTLHRRLTKGLGGEERRDLHNDLVLAGEVRNVEAFEDFDPYRPAWRSENPRPWPTNPQRLLLWAIDNEAELWVPTMAQLQLRSYEIQHPDTGDDVEVQQLATVGKVSR